MSELLKAQLHYREQEIDSLCNLNEELFGQISTLETELSDLKAAVRWTMNFDSENPWELATDILAWKDATEEDRKHARTLLEVLEK